MSDSRFFSTTKKGRSLFAIATMLPLPHAPPPTFAVIPRSCHPE